MTNRLIAGVRQGAEEWACSPNQAPCSLFLLTNRSVVPVPLLGSFRLPNLLECAKGTSLSTLRRSNSIAGPLAVLIDLSNSLRSVSNNLHRLNINFGNKPNVTSFTVRPTQHRIKPRVAWIREALEQSQESQNTQILTGIVRTDRHEKWIGGKLLCYRTRHNGLQQQDCDGFSVAQGSSHNWQSQCYSVSPNKWLMAKWQRYWMDRGQTVGARRSCVQIHSNKLQIRRWFYYVQIVNCSWGISSYCRVRRF